jgi:hypothetical protein
VIPVAYDGSAGEDPVEKDDPVEGSEVFELPFSGKFEAKDCILASLRALIFRARWTSSKIPGSIKESYHSTLKYEHILAFVSWPQRFQRV